MHGSDKRAAAARHKAHKKREQKRKQTFNGTAAFYYNDYKGRKSRGIGPLH